MTLGMLGFLNPWLLSALILLPVIWWLLRTVPPRPRRLNFPPTRILVGLENRQKTPAKTPWWLTLIRMVAAALVILALAEPVLNPNRARDIKGSGPIVLVVDNGWAAGPRWAQRARMADLLIGEAEAQRRPVLIASTALTGKAVSLKLESPGTARETLAALEPQPYAPLRLDAAAALEGALAGRPSATIFWLSDGIDHDGKAGEFADRLSKLAGSDGGLVVVQGGAGEEALAVSAGLAKGGRLEASVLRTGGVAREGMLHAWSARGQRLGETSFKLAPGGTSSTVPLDMPLELRNQVARLEIAGERSAGAVQLLDARSRWHRVGIVSGASREQAQPLLSPTYYVERALAPYSELLLSSESNVAAAIDDLFKQGTAVMILADIGTLVGPAKERTEAWVRKGGVMVRFAGPRLEKAGDDLLPVALRFGGRTLGGALSWSTPQPLGIIEDDTPFAGLVAPADVLVNRQVLADPARLGTESKVWARLKDGTPLVTAERRGEGLIILFHVTANADWSNLPLSGLFVEMMQRIAALAKLSGTPEAGGVEVSERAQVDAERAGQMLAPLQTLDGYGILKSPPPTAQAIAAAKLAEVRPSAETPPGYYGPSGAARALNLIGPKTTLAALPAMPFATESRAYEGSQSKPLKPSLLALALGLIFIDILAVLILQGALQALGRGRPARQGAAAALLAIAGGLLLWSATLASAQQNTPAAPSTRKPEDAPALKATTKTTLAYVLSGDGAIDRTSQQGLVGLGKLLTLRTAVEPADPVGIDPTRDELAFYPILYWPVAAEARPLPEPVLAKIDAYMKQGGMIVFDTRDYGITVPGRAGGHGPGSVALQRLLGKLDVPRLEQVPDHHVLTKSFYLLRNFPGRWEGGAMWVEAEGDAAVDGSRKARRADGVSSILITSNDLAAAWALDERGRYIYPVVPGGERQREMAFRVGVNIVMYALTGNYKADQVHIPVLLERLGQ